MRVAGDFMTSIVNSPNLRRIMIRALARKRGRTDHGEAGRHAIAGMDLQKAFRILEIESTPFFSAAGQPRAVSSPLRVVVPEEHQSRAHFSIHETPKGHSFE